MSIAGTVVHKPEQAVQRLSGNGDGDITLNATTIRTGTKWRRVRVTHEWLAGIPRLGAATQSYIAINWNKHDGSGSYNHFVNAGGAPRNLTANAGTGVMELFAQCQHGEDPATGWWHGFFTGCYTVGGGSPTAMGGDYFDFSARFAFQGPSLILGATGITRQTISATWDWPA